MNRFVGADYRIGRFVFLLALAVAHLAIPVGAVLTLQIGRVRFVALFSYAVLGVVLFDTFLLARRYPPTGEEGSAGWLWVVADARTITLCLSGAVVAFSLLGRGPVSYVLSAFVGATLLYRAVSVERYRLTLLLTVVFAAVLSLAHVFTVAYLAQTFDTIKHVEIIARIIADGNGDAFHRSRFEGFLMFHYLGSAVSLVTDLPPRVAAGILVPLGFTAATVGTFGFVRRWSGDSRLALVTAVVLVLTPAFTQWASKAHYQSLSFVYFPFVVLAASGAVNDRRLPAMGVLITVAWLGTHHFSLAVALVLLAVPIGVDTLLSIRRGSIPNGVGPVLVGATVFKWTVLTNWFRVPFRWIRIQTEKTAADGSATPTTTEDGTRTPAETPTETESATPLESPTATPTEGSTKTPAEGSTKTPGEGSTKTPGEGSTKTPGEGSTKTPAESPTKTPAESPTKTPAEGSATTPAESPTKTPAEGSTTTPTESPTTTPPETSTATPTEGSTSSALPGGVDGVGLRVRVVNDLGSLLSSAVPFLLDYLYFAGLIALAAIGSLELVRTRLRECTPLLLGGLFAAVFFFPNPSWIPLRGIAEFQRWDIMTLPFVAVLVAAGILAVARSGVTRSPERRTVAGVGTVLLAFLLISSGFYAPTTSDFVGADRHDRQFLSTGDVRAGDWTLEYASTSKPVYATSKLQGYLSFVSDPVLGDGGFSIHRTRVTGESGTVIFNPGLTVFQRTAFEEDAVKVSYEPTVSYYPDGFTVDTPVSEATIGYDRDTESLVYDNGDVVVHWSAETTE